MPSVIDQLISHLERLGIRVHNTAEMKAFLEKNGVEKVEQAIRAGSQLRFAHGVRRPGVVENFELSSAIMTQANTYEHIAEHLKDNIDGNVEKRVILFGNRAYLWSTENGYEFFIEQSLAINEKNKNKINELLDTYGTDRWTADAINSLERSGNSTRRSRIYLDIAKSARNRFGDRQNNRYGEASNGTGVDGNLVANSDSKENGLDLFIGKRVRPKFEQTLRKARPDMSEEDIQSTLNFLHSLEDTKENAAYIKTAIRWVANKSIILPRDNVKARQTFDEARKRNLNIEKYKSLGELIASPEMQPKEKEKQLFNPDEAKTFRNKRTVTTEGGRVFTVYDVDDTPEAQREVCKAVAAHYAKSPWCLSTFTAHNEPTKSAEHYWKIYDGIPRKIAYENGKPVAFCSDDYNSVSGFNLFGIPVKQVYFTSAVSDKEVEIYLLDIDKASSSEITELVSLGYISRTYELTPKGIQALTSIDDEAWWDLEDLYPHSSLDDEIINHNPKTEGSRAQQDTRQTENTPAVTELQNAWDSDEAIGDIDGIEVYGFYELGEAYVKMDDPYDFALLYENGFVNNEGYVTQRGLRVMSRYYDYNNDTGDFSLTNNDIEAFYGNPYISIYDNEEIEILRHDLFNKFKSKSSFGCVGRTANYWYLCDYFGDGDYKIREQIKIDGNEEYLNKIEKKLGKRTFRNTREFIEWITTITDGKGQYNNGNVNVEIVRAATNSDVSMVGGKIQKGGDANPRGSDGYGTIHNEENQIDTFTIPDGEIYGFVDADGEVYFDKDAKGFSSEHVVHEYTHLWDRVIQKKNPKFWARGVYLMQHGAASLWNDIADSPQYGKKWIAMGLSGTKLENKILLSAKPQANNLL